jgi:hypothetical protein
MPAQWRSLQLLAITSCAICECEELRAGARFVTQNPLPPLRNGTRKNKSGEKKPQLSHAVPGS